MPQIQPADYKARRRAILIISVAAVVGCLSIVAFEAYQPDLETWLWEEPERVREKLNWIPMVFAVLSIPALVAALHIWRIGQSIINARRFPPPGMPVAVDSPIITGKKAVYRGWFFRFFSLFLFLSAVAVPVVFWWFLHSFFGDI